MFNDELQFEKALIAVLKDHGWEKEVIQYPTEDDLLRNWAEILYNNNKGIDRLNNCPLTDGEMQQIIEQVNVLKAPVNLNTFINGKTVSIKRDNPADALHFGKEVSLHIYDRLEIAGGKSRYQIVEQPKFKAKNGILPNRRGDLMLLINGMPVIHIELKRSLIPLSQATNQIQKYSHEGIFSGIFSLIQVFVAMTPEEAVYFANPGSSDKFNPSYFFHWADFNNEPINEWNKVAEQLLSIPMAHQLIGFYTVADGTDGVLKVMRSYQYYAASGISAKVAKSTWDKNSSLGGYIWHTTGSGKTMTSFKSAQLIANSKDADKVVFLVDRIELGTQSFKEYQGFSDDMDSIQETEDTVDLINKLKNDAHQYTLIVTSIQKMSILCRESNSLKSSDYNKIRNKRIVFIVDECHRSTFGDMLIDIKTKFPEAMFFGFTGTPIHEENQKKHVTQAMIFGDEIHRYSIADGIRDKNVLGFDTYKVLTMKDNDLKQAIAFDLCHCNDLPTILSSPSMASVYYDVMAKNMIEIEGKLSANQYNRNEHRDSVVSDILDNWIVLSRNSQFHAILATSSIAEAIEYYRLFKTKNHNLKITALFDSNIDNNGVAALNKEDGLVEIIDDYNIRYGKSFSISNFSSMKKDISARLAHKEPYRSIQKTPQDQIDLLIVVDQMLTGFDSKWINTLYLDKRMKYESIIQAFSRTNRLFGPAKPFGIIKYYRYPHTMEQNIAEAVKLYSGDKPFGLFVQKLKQNISLMNSTFYGISCLFESEGIKDFSKLPADVDACRKFAKLFNEFNGYLEAARIQGFNWKQKSYTFSSSNGTEIVDVTIDHVSYIALVNRYKELFQQGSGASNYDLPYDIQGHITEIDTGTIDNNYMNSQFKKYLKLINTDEAEQALSELHKSFSSLSIEDQKFAYVFLSDVQSGAIIVDESKTLIDYIAEYKAKAQNDEIAQVASSLGIDENKLRNIILQRPNSQTLDAYGRFNDLVSTANTNKAKDFFEKQQGKTLPPFMVRMEVDNYLRKFILKK